MGGEGQNKTEEAKMEVERSKGAKRNTQPQGFLAKTFEEEPKHLSLKK
jgi:hypothetical protein